MVEIAPLQARRSFTQRLRPVLGGASGAVHISGTTYTGTLGMAVRGHKTHDGRFFVLSNNHVLANENRASKGDPVLQPGTMDGGDPDQDVIGKLFEFVAFQFGDPDGPLDQQPKNRVDAALAEIDYGAVSREIFWVGYPKGWRHKVRVEEALEAAPDGKVMVQKSGRTTAYTTGYLTDLGYDGWVKYDEGRYAYFQNQMLIRPGTFSDSEVTSIGV